MGPASEKEEREGGDGEGETPWMKTGEVIRVGGGFPPPKENTDLLDFNLERAHLLLQEVYGFSPRHNDGSHLYGGVADDAIWQSRWRRLAAQSASWYNNPAGAVGHCFTAILAVE